MCQRLFCSQTELLCPQPCHASIYQNWPSLSHEFCPNVGLDRIHVKASLPRTHVTKTGLLTDEGREGSIRPWRPILLQRVSSLTYGTVDTTNELWQRRSSWQGIRSHKCEFKPMLEAIQHMLANILSSLCFRRYQILYERCLGLESFTHTSPW